MTTGEPWPARHEGDEGLQPQRTELAWRRTSLALFGLSLASAKVLEPAIGLVAIALAVAGIALAGTLAWGAHRRTSRPTSGARLVSVCALVSVLLGLGSLAFVVSR
jgi:putative membrane protein